MFLWAKHGAIGPSQLGSSQSLVASFAAARRRTADQCVISELLSWTPCLAAPPELSKLPLAHAES